MWTGEWDWGATWESVGWEGILCPLAAMAFLVTLVLLVRTAWYRDR